MLILPNARFPKLGATQHVIVEEANLLHKSKYHGSYKVFVGDGSGLHIKHIGLAHIISTLSPHTTFTLHNLLHVPTTTKNLISVNSL